MTDFRVLYLLLILEENILQLGKHLTKYSHFAMVDTNADPRLVDFGIPANDDASKSIEIILNKITSSIKNGLELRNKEK